MHSRATVHPAQCGGAPPCGARSLVTASRQALEAAPAPAGRALTARRTLTLGAPRTAVIYGLCFNDEPVRRVGRDQQRNPS
jgi:hypothetical protein